MKTRLLTVLPSLEGGGAEKFVCRLMRDLPRDRFDLHLGLLRKTGPNLQLLPSDITVHDLGGVRCRAASLPLLRLIRRLRPETVHTTGTELNILAGCLKHAFPSRVRLVISQQNTPSALPRLTGGGMGFAAMRHAFGNVDQVVAISKADRRRWIKLFGLDPERVTAIYNPIDPTIVPPKRLDDQLAANPFSRPLRVVVACRLIPAKAVDRLLDAWPELLRKAPQAHLAIYGEGPERENLESQTRRLGIGSSVSMPGYVTDIDSRMQNADLFLLTSRIEAFGNVVVESIAAGCPLAANRPRGGSGEVMNLLGLGHRNVADWSQWPATLFDRSDIAAAQPLLARHFSGSVIAGQYADVLEAPVMVARGRRSSAA